MSKWNNYSLNLCYGRSKLGWDREQELEEERASLCTNIGRLPGWGKGTHRAPGRGLARDHRAEDQGRETKEETIGHALGEDGRARSCRAGGPESAVQTVLWVPSKGDDEFSAWMWHASWFPCWHDHFGCRSENGLAEGSWKIGTWVKNLYCSSLVSNEQFSSVD